MEQKRKASVFILLGQSNAVGHGIPMGEEDIISVPMKHVFGLSRTENQSFDIEQLSFSGYLSCGMNLGETQDNTYSLANCLAKEWEKAAEQNKNLSDLYIIQIAVGAQGIGPGYMWNPSYPQTIIPGELGIVDISLFPLTQRVLSLVDSAFDRIGIEYDIIGVHWRGGENDTMEAPEVALPMLRPLYIQLFDMLRSALGKMPPIVLYEMEFGMRNYERTDIDTINMKNTSCAINGMFHQFAHDYSEISTFSPFELSLFRADEPQTYGLFLPSDGIHYSAEANREIAKLILQKEIDRSY